MVSVSWREGNSWVHCFNAFCDTFVCALSFVSFELFRCVDRLYIFEICVICITDTGGRRISSIVLLVFYCQNIPYIDMVVHILWAYYCGLGGMGNSSFLDLSVGYTSFLCTGVMFGISGFSVAS